MFTLGEFTIVCLAAMLVLDELLNLGVMVRTLWRTRNLDLIRRGLVRFLIRTQDLPDGWNVLGYWLGHMSISLVCRIPLFKEASLTLFHDLTNNTSFFGPIMGVLDLDGSLIQLLLVGRRSAGILHFTLQIIALGLVLGHGGRYEKVGRTKFSKDHELDRRNGCLEPKLKGCEI